MAVLESTFEKAILRAVNKPHGAVRLWRQRAGKFKRFKRAGEKTEPRGAIMGAPKGAADLSGLVRGSGLRVEVEVKSAKEKQSPAQKRWERFICECGGLYLLVRYDERKSLEQNVKDAVTAIDRAVRDHATNKELMAHIRQLHHHVEAMVDRSHRTLRSQLKGENAAELMERELLVQALRQRARRGLA